MTNNVIIAATVVDHIQALSLGGGSHDSNLVGMCKEHNQAKAELEQQWLNDGLDWSDVDHAATVADSLPAMVKIAIAAKKNSAPATLPLIF